MSGDRCEPAEHQSALSLRIITTITEEGVRNLSTPLGQFFGWIVESAGSGGLIQVVPGRLGGSGCLRTNLLGVAA